MYKVASILSLAALLCFSACSRQQSDWEKTRAANTTDAYEVFLKKYPNGEFTAQAEARVKELYEERDWQKARDIDTADAYQAFLKQYPEGKWSEEARIRVENFTLASAPSGGAPAGPAVADAQPPLGAPAPLPPPAPKPSHKAAQAATQDEPAAETGTGKYGVQLGAFKSGEDAANKRWGALSGKYPDVLSGLAPHVSPRKVSKGTMYRLQVVGLSGKRAHAICKSFKARALACVVLRPSR